MTPATMAIPSSGRSAERLTARAIREEKNLGQLIMEIVEAAAE
jgi:hypothetical protein